MFDSHQNGNQRALINVVGKLEELDNAFDYLGKTHSLRSTNFT